MEAEIWVIFVQAKGYPEQEKHNMDFHLEPSQGTKPANTIILDSWPHNCERIKFCYQIFINFYGDLGN